MQAGSWAGSDSSRYLSHHADESPSLTSQNVVSAMGDDKQIPLKLMYKPVSEYKGKQFVINRLF